MKRRLLFLSALFTFLCGLVITVPTNAVQAATRSCVLSNGTNTLQGALEGANYSISVPANWNGILVLYSHGYTFANQPLANPAPEASDAATAAALLKVGFALAGSSYSRNGWALQQAFHDQIRLLDYFNATCGHPKTTLAWGDSLGGMITAGLVQLYPDRFAGALPMCGVVAGGIGTWNEALDSAFAFNILLANSSLQVVHITDPKDLNKALTDITNAQKTPLGRARIALVSALTDLPGWFDPRAPEPAANDYTSQEVNQFDWESQVDFYFAFGARAELELRAGGNPSWNTSVDYRKQLAKSVDRQEVEALYKSAGLDLKKDLATLNKASRIKADPQAVQYLNKYITYNGQLRIPVLTMHTTGDGLVVNEDEQAYKSVVDYAGSSNNLRQVFVHRAGHCTFTPAERITALTTLLQRVKTGKWDDSTDPALLNKEAASLGATLNPAPPAFIKYTPAPFLRPFDIRSHYHN